MLYFILALLAVLSPFSVKGKLQVSELPVCTIEGETACLSRPEGISFSPSGDQFALANSTNGTITIYDRIEEGIYERVPSTIISGEGCLEYTHGVEFSPCGNYISAVGRNSRSVALFKKQRDSYQEIPHHVIAGNNAKMDYPAELAISPDGKMLGVANRKGPSFLTFYKQVGDGKYASFPCRTASELIHKKHNLSAPHALAFSPDGKTFATIHKRFRSVFGESALVIWDNSRLQPRSILSLGQKYFHSITFHPSSNYIAATNERKNVVIFERTTGDTFEICREIFVEKEERLESCKGVAFSPCGKYIGFTTTVPAVLIYQLFES